MSEGGAIEADPYHHYFNCQALAQIERLAEVYECSTDRVAEVILGAKKRNAVKSLG